MEWIFVVLAAGTLALVAAELLEYEVESMRVENTRVRRFPRFMEDLRTVGTRSSDESTAYGRAA
jgi:hypothetical protein